MYSPAGKWGTERSAKECGRDPGRFLPWRPVLAREREAGGGVVSYFRDRRRKVPCFMSHPQRSGECQNSTPAILSSARSLFSSCAMIPSLLFWPPSLSTRSPGSSSRNWSATPRICLETIGSHAGLRAQIEGEEKTCDPPAPCKQWVWQAGCLVETRGKRAIRVFITIYPTTILCYTVPATWNATPETRRGAGKPWVRYAVRHVVGSESWECQRRGREGLR